ncbi:unnamed protein product [Mytilus edulis]|uniref:Myb/SANT-like DNA-binding domain-containing protein n=1 Tax=Mytilus edulis TaxID=6550 RepID=A0A8S3TDC7_MYTED|nr:unnamed protein product [Mytilus edulis]
MAANVSAKTTRERKLNFTAIESNLISELATTHLELLQGKHSPEVTNAKKQEMWQDITSKVNALGVCLRTETEVRNRWRNLTRGAKQKFTTVQKERLQTGGPPPTQPSQAEENIINCMRDTASFRGVPGGQETLIEGPEDQLEHTLQSSVDVQFSAMNEEMEDIHFNAISDSSVPAAAPVTVVHEIVQTRTDLNVRSDEQEPPQKKTKKKTADDVYSLQCQVLERKLIKTNLQIQLYERLHSKFDDNLTTELLSFTEQ